MFVPPSRSCRHRCTRCETRARKLMRLSARRHFANKWRTARSSSQLQVKVSNHRDCRQVYQAPKDVGSNKLQQIPTRDQHDSNMLECCWNRVGAGSDKVPTRSNTIPTKFQHVGTVLESCWNLLEFVGTDVFWKLVDLSAAPLEFETLTCNREDERAVRHSLAK